MTVIAHGDRKYRTGERLKDPAEWPSLRVELWRHSPGVQSDLILDSTEVVLLLDGRSGIRRTGDGERQETVSRPGMIWICPAGVHERDVEMTASIECVHLFLPPTLIEQSALADYDLDPAKTQLAYAGGFSDPMIAQISSAFRGLLDRGAQPTDRLFVDGMQAALAAHLLGSYSADRWKAPARAPSIDARRLKRVLDYIEARLAEEISLEDLAAVACLSPFHFARQFRDTIGQTPHRYVTERRVEAAKAKLALNHSSLVEIALDTGFGSQANFTRVFGKITGLTPGQFRGSEPR
jgi:AraC family transcriptional regulator